MDIEKLIERLKKLSGTENLSEFDDATTALSTLQAENEKLRAELERVKRERDAAEGCIYRIEDDLDRGTDNDWAREHISEWESQKED
jgi:outer membrane murein-binding lipoprotein Lpp